MTEQSGASPTSQAPPIGFLTHSARSGGTVISRCLGSMRGIYLFSEISPVSLLIERAFNPLLQACHWHGLFTEQEIAAIAADINARKLSSHAALAHTFAMIVDRATAKGGHVLVRDWSHGDFWRAAWLSERLKPLGYPSTLAVLAQAFRPVPALTTRHPISTWNSYAAYQERKGHNPTTTGPAFFAGLCAFAEAYADTPRLPFEALRDDPEGFMAALCAHLHLPYDPGFRARWSGYTAVTGDQIVPEKSVDFGPPLVADDAFKRTAERFADNADLRRVLSLWGYRPDDPAPATPALIG